MHVLFDNGVPRGATSVLSKRVIAVVVLSKGSWPLIRKKLSEIAAAVDAATAGSYAEVEIPVDPDSGSY